MAAMRPKSFRAMTRYGFTDPVWHENAVIDQRPAISQELQGYRPRRLVVARCPLVAMNSPPYRPDRSRVGPTRNQKKRPSQMRRPLVSNGALSGTRTHGLSLR